MAIHTTGGEANVAQPERAEPARRSTPFSGILFERPELLPVPAPEQPAHFSDLNLDQVVAAITQGRALGWAASAQPIPRPLHRLPGVHCPRRRDLRAPG